MQMAHGGDIDQIERLYGIPKEEIINFSGNVNPLGVPPAVTEAVAESAKHLSRYPDSGYVLLRESIGAYARVSADSVIVGNGATELISLYINTIGAEDRKRAVIISPAYSEYKRAADKAGIESLLFRLREEDGFELDECGLMETLDETVGTLIVCNPNNPTGAAITNGTMERILKRCAVLGAGVMADETYAEFTPEGVSSAGFVEKHKNLFVVRGTSKFFAAPGLRLGYGLCGNSGTLAAMNAKKDPWSVSVMAEAAGAVMFSDAEYIARTKRLIVSERERMAAELKTWPWVKVYDSRANFILVRLQENCGTTSSEIFDKMIQKRLLIRDCRGFSYLDERFIRFCVMKPEENELLLKNLRQILGEAHL